MPYMAPTKIMMLGKLQGDRGFGLTPNPSNVQRLLQQTFMTPRRITPQQPQNLLRQTIMGGMGRTGRMLSGLAGENVAFDVSIGEAQIAASVLDPNTGLPATGATALPPQADSLSLSGMLGGAALVLASAAISAYHGYRRDRKPMSAIGWGFMGALFPVITPVVAVAQGYGKRKGR